MNKLLLLILFVSFYSLADSKKYENTYQNYLNKCANDVSNSTHYSYSTEYPIIIFEGNDLSTDCLVEQFTQHHKNTKIPDLVNPDKFLEVNNINLYFF